MKRKISIPEKIVAAAGALYILLFVYAALSKLLDYSGFHRQLAMSPVLTAHASWLAWLVPVLELLMALLLAFPRTRLAGMFGSYCLMGAFTAYIYLIMNYASHVPCSCGGILENMGWMEHFYFNLAFLALAVASLFLEGIVKGSLSRKRRMFLMAALPGGLLVSAGLTLQLFLASERIVHFENRFQRRYPHPSVLQTAKAPLPYNSYYIAGFSTDRIYLGNSTAPLHLLSCDFGLKNFKREAIRMDTAGVPFSGAQVRVENGKFYLLNGTVPYVYEGSLLQWEARKKGAALKRFTLAEVLGDSLAVRTFSEQGDNLLGIQPLSAKGVPAYNAALLQKQADGIFDTDGTLLAGDGRAVYLYFYRNEFVVADGRLKIVGRGRTIDTISRAQVMAASGRQGLRQMQQVPLLVNRRATLSGNLLFVNSQLPGKEDIDKLWKQASIIDVYDIRDSSYRFSFPLYDIEGRKLDSFKVIGRHIYLINEKWIVRYDLDSGLADGQ